MDIQKIQPRNSFMSDKLFPILHSLVKSYIVEIRQHPVIVDADVAALYGVETKRVNEAVKNNPDKFPEDYMFVLTSDELKDLRSKISTTNLSAKSRSLPKAFTEKGLYMLATILKNGPNGSENRPLTQQRWVFLKSKGVLAISIFTSKISLVWILKPR